MAETQLARGIWTGFGPTEDPFKVPNGMVANLRTVDDHLALYTLQPPLPVGSTLPTSPDPGDGQAFDDGRYAVFNAGTWEFYPARKGIRVVLSTGTDCWDNTGVGWTQFSVEVSKPALDAVIAAGNVFVGEAQAARDAAELAMDGAMVGADFHASLNEGLASVGDGETFKVVGSGEVAARLYRRTNASNALLLAEFPSSSFVEKTGEAADLAIGRVSFLSAQSIAVAFTQEDEQPLPEAILDLHGRWDPFPGLDQVALVREESPVPLGVALDPYGRYDDGMIALAVDPGDRADVLGGVLDAAAAVVRGFDPVTGAPTDQGQGESVENSLLEDAEGVVYVQDVAGFSTIKMLRGLVETQFPPGVPSYDAYDPDLRRNSYIAYRSPKSGVMQEWRTDILPQRQDVKRTAVIEHCIGYGQSNSEPWGIRGSYFGHITPAGEIAPGRVLMFNRGIFPTYPGKGSGIPWTPELKSAPLAPDRISYFINTQVDIPVNPITGDAAVAWDYEVPGFGFAAMYEAQHSDVSLLLSAHGVGGFGITQLWRGTQPYDNILRAVRAGRDSSHRVGMPYRIGHVDFIHGESDFSRASYKADVQQLMTDLDADIAEILGDEVDIPWFAIQAANWTAVGGSICPLAPLFQLALHEENPGKFMLYAPGYFTYHGAAVEPYQDIHIDAYAVRLRGEYLAKARKAFDASGHFDSLRATSVSWDGSYVWVDYVGRVGALQWNVYHPANNMNGVSDPGNYGFRFCDAAGAGVAVNVTAVAIVGNRVRITPSSSPVGLYLGYADLGVANATPGPLSGPRGCLSDSDTTLPSPAIQAFRRDPSRYWGGQDAVNAAAPLVNWCNVFRKPIL